MTELSLREPSERVSPRARLMWATSAGIEGAILVAALAVIGPVTDWLPIPVWAVVLVGVTSTGERHSRSPILKWPGP